MSSKKSSPQKEKPKNRFSTGKKDPAVIRNSPEPVKDKRISVIGKDENMIKFLKAQEDIPPPGLFQYLPNKQERALYELQNERHRGNLNQKTRQLKNEEDREKDLLKQLAQIRADNNKLREKIQDLTFSVKYSLETNSQRKEVLNKVQAEYNDAKQKNQALKSKESSKREELERLKTINEGIMSEMMSMKEKINFQIEKLSTTDQLIKKKEQELGHERDATEHLKEILKKSLAGKQMQDIEEDYSPKRKSLKPSETLEEKITLEKFLAIMQAIKNEKEVSNKAYEGL